MNYPAIVFTLKAPFLVNRSVPLQVGYIDENGELTNVTLDPGLTYSPISNNATITPGVDALIVLPSSEGSVIYVFEYEGLQTYFSFYAQNGVAIPDQQAMRVQTFNYLPPECYLPLLDSGIGAKLNGFGAVFSDLYQNLLLASDNFFPPFVEDQSWQDMLDNYYPWAASFDFGLVVQTFRNLPLKKPNYFDMTLAVSQYIYARLGLSLYVYIQNAPVDDLEAWILDDSALGDDTILEGGVSPVFQVTVWIQTVSLPADFLQELQLFLNLLLPASIESSIGIEPDFSVFGLLIEVGDVWEQDPRLLVPFALQYDGNAVYDAIGLISPYNPIFLVSYDYVPPGGLFEGGEFPLSLTATAVYEVAGVEYPLDVTADTTFVSGNEAVITVAGNELTALGDGESIITASWTDQTVPHLFIVTDDEMWIVGASDLDDDTVVSG